MKIAKVRLKQLPHRKIKDTQKLYHFICPIDDVEIGDYVLVELKQKKVSSFGVGRVDELEILTLQETTQLEPRPDQLVFSKINVDNFEKRCDTALLIRRKVMTLYTEYDKKKAKRRANWLRKQQLLKEQQKTEKIESNEKN